MSRRMVGQRRAPLLLRPALRRFWLVPVVLAVMGAAVGDDIDLRRTAVYRASAVYVVTTGADTGPTVLSVDANSDRLSRTYALVLRQDQQLLSTVAAELGTTTDSVRASIDSRFVAGSASIIVTYSGRDPAQVDRFFRVFTDAVVAEQPATDNIEGGLLRPVRLPQLVRPLSSGIDVDWRLGALAGLLAGLAVAVVAERAAPRVHDVHHLQLLTARHVVDRLRVRPDHTDDLVRLVGNRLAARTVAVIALGPAPYPAASTVAAECARRTRELVLEQELSEEAAGTRWLPFTSQDAARLAQATPSTAPAVVLVLQGQLVRRVDDELERLGGVLSDRPVVLALVDEELLRHGGRGLRHRELVAHP